MQASNDSRNRPQCRLLDEKALKTVTELLSDTNLDYGYRLCSEPSEDPTQTCFMKPSSWDEIQGKGDWVCFHGMTESLAPKVDADDSY